MDGLARRRQAEGDGRQITGSPAGRTATSPKPAYLHRDLRPSVGGPAPGHRIRHIGAVFPGRPAEDPREREPPLARHLQSGSARRIPIRSPPRTGPAPMSAGIAAYSPALRHLRPDQVLSPGLASTPVPTTLVNITRPWKRAPCEPVADRRRGRWTKPPGPQAQRSRSLPVPAFDDLRRPRFRDGYRRERSRAAQACRGLRPRAARLSHRPDRRPRDGRTHLLTPADAGKRPVPNGPLACAGIRSRPRASCGRPCRCAPTPRRGSRAEPAPPRC
ncbi:hypothetical protein STSP_03870 [Streptomyces jeddahensis]|uniref:Uncharacterized protein n=1 Tax=Streptomyces jeddahensis TaxID=1716141 RepID=A0A177HZI6_9ACTN|nr:hypothetical protein STSP_03870 [Streptomyces jeddahensis]